MVNCRFQWPLMDTLNGAKRFWIPIVFGLILVFSDSSFSLSATYTLTPSTLLAQPGQSVSVNWTIAGSSSAKDWIGWFRVGDPNSAYDTGRWRYTNGLSSGSFTITTPTTPGTYEFRLLINDGFTDVARTQPISLSAATKTNSNYELMASSTTVQSGQTISVTWLAPSSNPRDWIGWFKASDPNTSFDSARWRYTNGATSGTFVTTAPTAVGTYEFRYLINDGFTSTVRSQQVSVTGSSSPLVNVAASNYSLAVSAVTVQVGQALNVNWSAPAGSSKDWIGIYKVGDANTAYDPNRWRYTNGTGSGTFSTTAPNVPGAYEFRYLINDGFTSIARSQSVTVNPGSMVASYSLTLAAASVSTGQSITVSWTSPGGVGNDWIGFFPSGASNNSYDRVRWRYTNGAGTGTFTTTAPETVGTYEFRYLTGGGFTDVARSTPLSVSVGTPIITLTTNLGSINAGQFARLSWSTTNASGCSGSGGWSGAKALSGVEDVSPTSTTTYTLSCSGAGGTASQNISIIVASGSAGRTFYVATNGDDGNPGTEGAPFKTLKRAMSVLRAGDTLLVRAGEYDTALGVSGALSDAGASIIPSGDSWNNPVTIKAYPGEKPVFRRYLPAGYGYTEEEVRNSIHLPTYQECAQYASYGLISDFPYSCWQGSGNNQPAGGLFWQAPKGFVSGYVVDMYNIRAPVQYVIIDGIDIDAKGIVANPLGLSDYSKHIRFQNLEIRYGVGSCITQWANDSKVDMDLQFINTKIHSCGVPFDTNKVGGVLARKTIWARYWHGWYLHAGGVSFINSESFNHAGTGLTPDGNNVVVRNSKIYDNSAQGIYIAGGDNWLIENNIFFNNAYYEVYNYGGRNHTIRNNTIVAGSRNDYLTTGVQSAGIYLHTGSYGSVHENNIIDGFRFGVFNQSGMWLPNVVRNNLIRTNPAGSEIYSIGSNPITTSGNIFNRDPLFVDRAAGDYRLLPGSPAIGTATDGGNLGVR